MNNHLTELLDFLQKRFYSEVTLHRGRYASRFSNGRATMWRRKARRRWLGRRAKSLRAVAPKGALGGYLAARKPPEPQPEVSFCLRTCHPLLSAGDDCLEVFLEDAAHPAAYCAQKADRDEDPRFGIRITVRVDAAGLL